MGFVLGSRPQIPRKCWAPWGLAEIRNIKLDPWRVHPSISGWRLLPAISSLLPRCFPNTMDLAAATQVGRRIGVFTGSLAVVSCSLTGLPESSQTLIIFSIFPHPMQPRTQPFISSRLRGQCLKLGEEKSSEEESLFFGLLRSSLVCVTLQNKTP